MKNLAQNHWKQGFTLVELLVVIVILGILSTIAVPSYLNIVARTKIDLLTSAVHQYLRNVQYEAISAQRSYTAQFYLTDDELKVTYYRADATPTSWSTLSTTIPANQLLFASTSPNESITFTPQGDAEQQVRVYLGIEGNDSTLRCIDVKNRAIAQAYFWFGKDDICLELPPWEVP